MSFLMRLSVTHLYVIIYTSHKAHIMMLFQQSVENTAGWDLCFRLDYTLQAGDCLQERCCMHVLSELTSCFG
jgi:hypothetical protein